jgi:hypothetical protein
MALEEPRLLSELQDAHDKLGIAVCLAPRDIFDDPKEHAQAIYAGTVLCWALGHAHAEDSDFARLLYKLGSRLAARGFLSAAEEVPE